MNLDASIAQLRAWAASNGVRLAEGIVELNSAVPQVTVVGFEPEDIHVFLALASALRPAVVTLDVPVFDEEDLRVAQLFTPTLADPKDRGDLKRVMTAARAHLGEVHEIQAIAFAPDLERALVFRSSTDWGADLFGLVQRLRDEIPE